ncbi:MAG: DUF4388 domain-containing protein, partial [Nannocystaceae bacterium]
MPNEPSHVLFVPSRIGAVQAALREVTKLGRDYAPVCVESVSQGEALMAGREVPFVVVGAADGGVCEEVRRAFPQSKVILVGERTEVPQVELAVRLRAAALIRTPCEASAFRDVFHRVSPMPALQGTCRGLMTAEVLAMYCPTGADGALFLHRDSDGASGCIHVEGGQPTHAAAGVLAGPEAVQEMLRWTDVDSRWVPGRSCPARTIIGRWEALMTVPKTAQSEEPALPLAIPQVIEKLVRLAQTPDILGAFLLRDGEVVTGRCLPQFDDRVLGRTLSRLANVQFDIEGIDGETAGDEVQATLGSVRLVVDSLGPRDLRYQVGVVVRQASPVCKSLRRLLRQIDRSFERSMKRERAALADRLA